MKPCIGGSAVRLVHCSDRSVWGRTWASLLYTMIVNSPEDSMLYGGFMTVYEKR